VSGVVKEVQLRGLLDFVLVDLAEMGFGGHVTMCELYAEKRLFLGGEAQFKAHFEVAFGEGLDDGQ
jgi:hypothetical protein